MTNRPKSSAADPSRVVEQFVVASWDEHLRQHGRVSVHDQDRLDKVRALTDPGRSTTVTHWLTPQVEHVHDVGNGTQETPASEGSPLG